MAADRCCWQGALHPAGSTSGDPGWLFRLYSMTESSLSAKDAAPSGRYPGWIARIFIVLALLVAALVPLMRYLEDPPFPFDDPAIRNLVTSISCSAAALAVWAWFCFRSSYPRRLRLGVAAVTALALIGFVVVIATLVARRELHFSGSLVPQLAPREHDAELPDNQAPMRQADLSTTTPKDFPQFLGPERSAWIKRPELARDWEAAPPQQLWKQRIGAGWSGFAAVNGFAITLEQRGGEEWVACYEVETGEHVWHHAIQARHESALGGVGPRSTPTIHDGRVYALGATGVLRCLDGSGKVLWMDDLRKRYGITASEDEQHVMFGRPASPLIVDSLVVVPGGGPQGKAKNLVAFDLKSGELVWEAENELPGGDADQIAYASPALATLAERRQILIVNESTASGHDPKTGERLWSLSWPGDSGGAASVSQPVAVGDDRVLLSKAYGGGAELIELSANADDELAVTSIWKSTRVLQTKFSNVVIRDGHAFGLSEGILECVNLENGRRRWKSGRYGHGQILGVGDLLLLLSEQGELHLLELNPDKLAHLGSSPALSGKTWNNLCLYGKRLLIRNAQEAACFELP